MIELPQDQHEALQICLALDRFLKLPETRPMADWLGRELSRLDAANRRELVDAQLRQRQGSCLAIDNILRLAAEAGDKAEKIRANLLKQGAKS